MPRWWDPPRDVRALVGFGTRHTLSTQDDPDRGIGGARDYTGDQFEQIARTAGGRMTVALDSYVQEPASRIPVPTRITNVVAALRGTDPSSADRVCVVGGHYDSRVTDVLNATSDAPGANDDESGPSAVLELARVLAERPTEATIKYVAVQGVLNMDIIGSPVGGNGVRSPHTIRLFSEGVPTAETAAETARRQAIGVDFRYLARVTRVVASSLAALARSPRAPGTARVISANLTYDTELRWNADPEAAIAGYEIVGRDSTSPVWEHVRRVGNVTGATIKNLDKDDNQVGVRAIDRDGNRSPVAYPIPASQ
ncbi:MAG TPA: M28 family peptidase [Solirubrobacteraceae bacterium]|nr:M28 family peptidase [Solirubrobacteraceae bacterium]